MESILDQLLEKRGIPVAEREAFLSPTLDRLLPPTDWPGVASASAVIVQAVLDGRHIGIWGDYDVDGITSTAVMLDCIHGMRFANKIKDVLSWHIPDRFTEGYGMNIPALERMHQDGVKLLITVDCGMGNPEVIRRAEELGMDVVVTDHHLPKADENGVSPYAGIKCFENDLACNPSLIPGALKQGKMLAGVGMAFMVMAAVNIRLGKMGKVMVDMRRVLDLVALGTVADVADLGGQNRILVSYGLKVLSKGSRIGISALKAVAGIAPSSSINAETIAFALAPRMNAAGRMEHADKALGMLLSSEDAAPEKARYLDALNRKRRDMEDSITEAAKRQAEELVRKGLGSGLVLYRPDWHPGIVGIVASRIVELYGVPAVVCCGAESVRGSGRSLPGYNLHGMLSQCSDLFTRFGGHPVAAGLSLPKENLQEFRERFSIIAMSTLVPSSGDIDFDMDLCPTVADMSFVEEMHKLEPCGQGNPAPVFRSGPLTLYGAEMRSGLLIMDLCDDDSGKRFRARKWRPASIPGHRDIGRSLTLFYTPKISLYGGAASVELDVAGWEFLSNVP